MNAKRVMMWLGIGLIAFWVAGIILANFFNVDMNGLLVHFSRTFSGLVRLVLAVGFIFTVVVGYRAAHAPDPSKVDDPGRYRKITLYFVIGVTLPILLTVIFILLGSLLGISSMLDSARDSMLVMGIGTILAASGLPFIAKMLLLIKSELKAVGTALLLVPYGLVLWAAILFLMLLMFNHASCC